MGGCHRMSGAGASRAKRGCSSSSPSATSWIRSVGGTSPSCARWPSGGIGPMRRCPSSRTWMRSGCPSLVGCVRPWLCSGTDTMVRWDVEMATPATPYVILTDPGECRRLWQEYGTIRGVARAVGCHPDVARKWLERAGVIQRDRRLPPGTKPEGIERPGPPPEPEGDVAARLVQMLRRQPYTIERLADALDRAPSRVRVMVEDLRAQGYA